MNKKAAAYALVLGLTGCATSSNSKTAAAVSPGVRVNKEHVTIHQDAEVNEPIITVAIENGDPSKAHFRNDVRILELAIIGDLEHPAACGVVIERFSLTTPYTDPVEDLMIADEHAGLIEKRGTVGCSEKKDSTRLTWPDNSVVMSGHLSYESVGDENSDDYHWEYHIDHIQEAPRIATFDPPGSFTWPAVKPIAATFPSPRTIGMYSAITFQTYVPLRSQRQSYVCSNSGAQTMTLEPYDALGAYRVTYRWTGTWKSIAPSSDLQGHDRANNLIYEGAFSKSGQLQRFATPQPEVPLSPHPGFVSKILYKSGAIYPRTWVGSTFANVNFKDAAGNERHDHLRVQVYKDAFAKGDLLSAYADGIGLVAMDYYQGPTALIDCNLTRVDNIAISKTQS